MDDRAVIAATRRWVASVVVELNLCPFARKVFEADRIRYVVSRATDEETLCGDLRRELLALAAVPRDAVETIILIHPEVLGDFLNYNDFLTVADATVRDLGFEGTFQIASFHPGYQFAGTSPTAVENYTNRSPYAMLHLLREVSVSEVTVGQESGLDIPRRNQATMQREGLKAMGQRLAEVGRERPEG